MIKSEKTIVINRPIEEVFAFMGNLENGPQWQPGLLEVRRVSSGPLGRVPNSLPDLSASSYTAQRLLGDRESPVHN